MDRLLVMCKTRIRPEIIKNMIRSFDETKQWNTDLVIYLDNDDPKLNEYDLLGHKSLVGERKTLSEAFNYLVSVNKDYDYYCEINDDMVFNTKGWDKILVDVIKDKGNGWGISFGNDLIHSGRIALPTQSVISSNIIKEVGYLCPPTLKHLFIDDTKKDIGEGIGKLFYCPEVIIEHRHYCVGKAPLDENYSWVNSQWSNDSKAYDEWKIKELPDILVRLNNAISCSN